MNNETFNAILDNTLAQTKKVLAGKAEEYTTDVDRLHNFKVAAELQGTTMRQALGGMMAKHTVSVYDLINAEALASPEMWAEKLGDHLNYLILLAAVVEEERGEEKESTPLPEDRWQSIDDANRWLEHIGRTEYEVNRTVDSFVLRSDVYNFVMHFTSLYELQESITKSIRMVVSDETYR